MKKNKDYVLDDKMERCFFTTKGIENIRKNVEKNMVKERKTLLNLLVHTGYPQIEVEDFSILIKAIVSQPEPGKIYAKMPQKLTKDVLTEKGNLISEIKINLRAKKETILLDVLLTKQKNFFLFYIRIF